MKINNPALFAARKDKKLSAMILIQREEKNEKGEFSKRTYIRLCIDRREKYTEKVDTIFVEADTEIKVENYSSNNGNSKREITQICFHTDVYREESHIRTFLNAIKKDSDVKFRVVAFNGSNFWKEKQAVSHQLYGLINNRGYLLDSYTGGDNLASPVR